MLKDVKSTMWQNMGVNGVVGDDNGTCCCRRWKSPILSDKDFSLSAQLLVMTELVTHHLERVSLVALILASETFRELKVSDAIINISVESLLQLFIHL